MMMYSKRLPIPYVKLLLLDIWMETKVWFCTVQNICNPNLNLLRLNMRAKWKRTPSVNGLEKTIMDLLDTRPLTMQGNSKNLWYQSTLMLTMLKTSRVLTIGE